MDFLVWSNRGITVKIRVDPAFHPFCGAVAQLGERLVRNEEATGSIPVSSTMFPKTYGKSGKGNVRPHLAGRDWLDAVAGLFDYFS